MSIILPSIIPPSQAGIVNSQGAARSAEPDPVESGSFGEALSRSMQPASEKGTPTDGRATPVTARRSHSDRKNDLQYLVNAMAVPFIPPDSKVVQATSSADGGAPVDNLVSGAAVAPRKDLLASTIASTDTHLLAPGMAPEMGKDAHVKHEMSSALASPGPKEPGKEGLTIQLDAEPSPVKRSSTIETGPEIVTLPASSPPPGLATERTKLDVTQPSSKNERPTRTSAVSDNTAVAVDATKMKEQPIKPSPTQDDASDKPEDKAAGQGPGMSVGVGVETLNASALISGSPAITPVPGQGPAGLAGSSAPSDASPAVLTPEVGSSEWGQALGQQVIQMDRTGHHVAELQLTPPGLGPLKVTLSMNDQQIQVLFVSAHSAVRAAVEAALPQLRINLADNGIHLGNTSVSADSQQQAFAQARDGQSGQQGRRDSALSKTPDLTSRRFAEPLRQSHGMGVDTFA